MATAPRSSISNKVSRPENLRPEVAISARNLSKLYQIRSAPEPRWRTVLLPRYVSAANRLDRWALRDVSFDLSPARKLALIGDNGSGKSTLLKLIAGLIQPTSGEITVNGSVLPLLELGAGFHPDLTGYENVFLQGAILGLSREEIRNRLGEIVTFSGLADFMETPVKYYSAGMFIRLGFSVAIHCNPDILLLDEILAVGDADFQDKSFNKMMEFVGRGKTLILVSHNVLAVKQICDEAIWLDEGRIRESGPARDIVEAYVHWNHDRTKAFLTRDRKACGPSLPQASVEHTVRIIGVRFLDANGLPLEQAVSNEPLTIEIECETDGEIPDVECRVVFRGKKDVAVLQIDSFGQGTRLTLPCGKSTIRAAVDSLAAKGATYALDVTLLYHPAGFAAAAVAESRSHLTVVNPDRAEINYAFDTTWQFELKSSP